MKVKEWIKEHKKEIVIVTVSATVGAIGGAALYKHKNREFIKINKGVIDVYNTLFPAIKGSYGAYLSYGYEETKTIKDCPKLIDDLLESDFVIPNEEIAGIAVFRKKTN